jgi:hypothetical protein
MVFFCGGTACQSFPNSGGEGTGVVDREDLSSTHWVDASTLYQKHLLGYQGWFGCKGDGSELDNWSHWSAGVEPTAATVTFDAWPDSSEVEEVGQCATTMMLADGTAAKLFSSHQPSTVDLHFKWMETAGLDGVFLQRFSSELFSKPHRAFRDQVAKNVRDSAENHGRVFTLMYDITSHDSATMVEEIKSDWIHLVDDLHLTGSGSYLRHKGLPLVGIWGFGFWDRSVTPAQAIELLAFFQDNPDERYRATVVGGVPTFWRTLSGDSQSDPAWADVYLSLDVLSPWAVGRYADQSGADAFRAQQIEPDLAVLEAVGVDYMPVIFPGFSWANITKNPGMINQIPRDGGRFYWRQVYNVADAGVNMLFTAMFDEVDEGTAMFKLASKASERPVQGDFLTLDADGETLPSDWYLDLAGAATEVIRGERSITIDIPISPSTEPKETPEDDPEDEPGEEDTGSEPAAISWNSFVVTRGYLGILGREPDPGGLASYVEWLEKGQSVEFFTSLLFVSEEYATTRAVLSFKQLATELYVGILQREPDASGLAATIEALESGRGAERVADMLESAEAVALWGG